MKVALINGSPKVKDSASQCLLQILQPLLSQVDEVSSFQMRKPVLTEDEIERLLQNEVLVFAFPLYVDGIPAHLLSCLAQLEEPLVTLGNKIQVYGVVNCGFYEGHQARWALEILENWCIKAGQSWGQGVGVGAGPMLFSLTNVPLGYGPLKNLGQVFHQLADNIVGRAAGESVYITPNFPKLAYKLAGEMSMRRSAKANGLRVRDLHRKK